MKGISKKSIRNALAILLCVVTVMLSLCSCSSDKNAAKEAESNNSAAETIGSGKALKLEDYVKVTYSAMDATLENLYSGYAKPVLEVDYDKLGEDIGIKGYKNYHIEVEGHDKKRVDSYFEGSDHVSAINYFKIDFKDYYEYISNGDVITVELSVKSDSYTLEETVSAMNISIEKELNITVEGLKQAKELDLMGEVEKYIVYSGANGYGHATTDFSGIEEPIVLEGVFYLKPKKTNYGVSNVFDVIYNNENIGSFGYCMDKNPVNNSGILSYGVDELTEGDVYYIQINNPNLFANLIKLGYTAKETVRKVVAPDLGEYVTSKNELTEADIEVIRQDVADTFTAKRPDAEISSAYFATINAGEVCEANEKTIIVFACKVPVYSGIRYYSYVVNGVAKTKSGEIKYEDIVEKYTMCETAEEFESKLDTAYTYEKIF